jgi:protoporphyrinogen oxidase
MAYQWIGERVNVTDIERVLESILFEKDDYSWGPNNTFSFPRKGGTGAIWHSIANLIGIEHIKLNSTVIKIKSKEKKLELSNGEIIEYQYLLSTMPLDILTSMVDGVPEELKETAKDLMHSTSNIVGIGLRGKPKDELSTKCWMYFPESNCPFYRVTVFSNYSPNNVPDINKYWSLMTETSESPEKPVNRSTLIEDTVQGLLNTKLIESRSDIVSTWMHTADYGYPTPSLQRDSIIKDLIPALKKLDVYSRGRFGGWKYEVGNQDHCMMQGVEWANKIILKIPEITFPCPSIANSNYAK